MNTTQVQLLRSGEHDDNHAIVSPAAWNGVRGIDERHEEPYPNGRISGGEH